MRQFYFTPEQDKQCKCNAISLDFIFDRTAVHIVSQFMFHSPQAQLIHTDDELVVQLTYLS